jgi:hypothetical protein
MMMAMEERIGSYGDFWKVHHDEIRGDIKID